MRTRHESQEIACQQVLTEDSSVFSIQWSIFPEAIAAGLTPRRLMNSYLDYIIGATCSAIRPIETATGIEFRLLGSRLSLISFQQPEKAEDSITMRICGGMLVQPHQCHRGELQFRISAISEGVKVSLQLADYCPLILGNSSPSVVRRWLYRLTQAAIHRLVTVRFLAMLYRDLAGSAARVNVINVKVRDGRPI